MKRLFLFIILLQLVVCTVKADNQNGGKISKEQAIEDVDSLVYMLCEVHPNVFSMVTPTKFLMQVNAIKQSFRDSLTTLELYQKVAPLVASVGDGHTSLTFPFNDVFRKETPRFPLMVSVNSNDSTITTRGALFGVPEGVKIVSINGIGSKEIIQSMMKYVSGERTFFKLTCVNSDFLAWFHMLYRANEYKIEYLENGKLTTKRLRSVSVIEKRNEMSKGLKEVEINNSVHYDILNKKAALMNIPSFRSANDIAKVCQTMVADLNRKRIENLIIDVRDNGGGTSMAVDTLLTYIANKPFMQYEKVWAKITPTTQTMTRRPYNKGCFFGVNEEKIQPISDETKRFKGKVWVLMNHHTFSAAASFVWTIKAFKIGTLVGEEAGGMNVAYGDVVSYALPHSKLHLGISFKRFWLYGADETNIHGALPDILAESDNALKVVLDKIHK